MTKDISTLSDDIYHLLDPGSGTTHDSKLAAEYAMNVGIDFATAIEQTGREREKGKLWASDLGKPCLRQHWYNFNPDVEGEEIQGHTRFKFLYGNILENAVIYLAKEAGHKVTHEQERIEREWCNGWRVSGRVDCVIDDVLVDVKSTSSYGFKNYKEPYSLTSDNDNFGYLYQLGFYNAFIDLDVSDEGQGFIWIDKQNGHIAYSPVHLPTSEEVENNVLSISAAIEEPVESSVPKAFSPEPYGKSGNMKLPTACSYCPFKKTCWRDANNGKGLRTFLYSHGPVHFTEIKRAPAKGVMELKDDRD